MNKLRNTQLMIISLSIFLFSCSSEKYKYIETNQIKSQSGKSKTETEEKLFYAKSDSAAFCKAVEFFCISKRAALEISKNGSGIYYGPVSFSVFSPEGIDISNINFENIDSIIAEIEDKILTLNTIESKQVEKPKTQIDTQAIANLREYFIEETDEFDPQKIKWITPKSAPKYLNRNGIYCYFQLGKDGPKNLRFKFQYYSNDWIFFTKVQFLIDNEAFEYFPINQNRDNGEGKIWEWFDDAVNQDSAPILEKLSDAKIAKVKLVGSKNYEIKSISLKEIDSIKKTLEYFRALGGDI